MNWVRRTKTPTILDPLKARGKEGGWTGRKDGGEKGRVVWGQRASRRGGREGGREEGQRACDRQARGKTTSRRSCLVLARSLRRRPNDRLGPPQLERTERKEERREKGRKRQGTGEGRDEEGRVARREGWRGGEREGKRVARPRYLFLEHVKLREHRDGFQIHGEGPGRVRQKVRVEACQGREEERRDRVEGGEGEGRMQPRSG